MSTYRVRKDKNNPYVMMNKEFLSNENLSFKAKGILSYLLSKPDDWKVYEDDLVNQSKDGKTAVRSGLKELQEQGYIIRTLKRTKEGKFDGYDYDVYEYPVLEDCRNNKDLAEAGFPKTGNPKSENNKVLNNDLTNNKIEEEEENYPQKLSLKIANRYQKIFNRQLTVEFFNKLTNICSDPKIIFKALEFAEEKADKPSWLLVTLRDWKDHKLKTLKDIEKYIKNRRSKSSNDRNTEIKSLHKNLTQDEIAEKYYSKGYR